jgi:hypothetical protein
MPRGALHVHSTYSDGEFTLAELRRVLLDDGCAFACVTDHAEWFDTISLARYVGECRELSDAAFTFIPGLEYECEERLHIVGYGCTTLLDTIKPEEVITSITAHHGLAVIAHPKTMLFPWIESFDVLPLGLEVWNSKYDGRYAPRPETFALFDRLKQRRPDMLAFYGQDLHWRKQYRGLQVDVEATDTAPADVLSALAAGRFQARKDDLRLPSTGGLPESQLEEFARIHRRSDRLRGLIKATKRLTDSVGLSVPPGVKGQLRRIF